MKKRALTIAVATMLVSGSLYAQTLTDVINEFNAGVESMNGQSYESALAQFNAVLDLCEVVGEEADDMKEQAREQIVGTYYRQAITLMKRKQYDKALPALEKTVALSAEYDKNPEFAENAKKYLPSLYLREGNVHRSQGNYDEALNIFDKALELRPSLYKAHQGKGLVYKETNDIEKMLEEFSVAKAKAVEEGDEEVVDDINSAINGHYHALIEEELMMIDPEEADYTFLLDICEEAIEANEKNGYAYWKAASAYNKMVEYDSAIEYAEKGIAVETDPVLLSALYYELGMAYQNTVRYADACEAYNKVTEEPFTTRAEKKMMTTPDCN
ncbi:MAG: tetratricopeptide repeat protein [Bacteroidales bacterium]